RGVFGVEFCILFLYNGLKCEVAGYGVSKMDRKEDLMRQIGRQMGIRMGILMSICLSGLNLLLSGHFTVVGLALNVLISSLVSIGISFVVPVGKISQQVCEKKRLMPGSIKARLLESLISDLVYTPVMTLVLVFFAYGMAMMVSGGRAQIPFVPMFVKSLIISLAAGYVLIFVFQPLFLKGLFRKHGITMGAEQDDRVI
nr:hypothetical protein [Lachnospiraceae bacterium]